MGEMIERVARALCTLDGHSPDADWRDCGGVFLTVEVGHPFNRWWTKYTKPARAAIEEMRDPTLAMVEAGVLAPLFGEDYMLKDQVYSAYAAMIDAALAEPQAPTK